MIEEKDIELITLFLSSVKKATLQSYIDKGWFDNTCSELTSQLELINTDNLTCEDFISQLRINNQCLAKLKQAAAKWQYNKKQKKLSINEDVFGRLERYKDKLGLDSYNEALLYLFSPEPFTSVIANVNNDIEIKSLSEHNQLDVFYKSLSIEQRQFFMAVITQFSKEAYQQGLKCKKFDERFDQFMESHPVMKKMKEDEFVYAYA